MVTHRTRVHRTALLALLALGACDNYVQYQPCPECKLRGLWRTTDAGQDAALYAAYVNTLNIFETGFTLKEEGTYVPAAPERAGCASYLEASGMWSGGSGTLNLAVVNAARQLQGCTRPEDNMTLGNLGKAEFPTIQRKASGPYVLSGDSLSVTIGSAGMPFLIHYARQIKN